MARAVKRSWIVVERRQGARYPIARLFMWRLLVISLLIASCGDNPPPVYPTVAPIDETQLTLGPGDKIELVVYAGTRQSKAQYVLDSSGEIEVQYIGTVAAGAKTAKSVQEEIQTKLADGFLIDPIVSLSVLEINS